MAENNELYDVIDANIVPNGVKGITAQGLKNTLYAMADKIGEGGGGSNVGAGGLYIYFGTPVSDSAGEISQTPEQKAHNAEVFKIIKKSAVIPPLSVDITDYMLALEELPDGVDATGMKTFTSVQMTQYYTEELASFVGLPECILLSFIVSEALLLADGSILRFG